MRRARGGSLTRSTPGSASRRCKRPCGAFRSPKSSTPTKEAQFTAEAFTRVLRDREIKVSMDGKGRCIDNIFVERLWRSLKYEEVYLHAYDSPLQARGGIGRYLNFYNLKRPHQALGYQTPDAFYRGLTNKVA
jgi:putative transposase